MGTYVISDMLFLGPTVEDSMKALEDIKKIKSNNGRIILLSNRPSLCMKPIYGEVNSDNLVEYYYDSVAQIKKGNIEVKIVDEDKTIIKELISYDLTVFGNGISIFNSHDESVYSGSSIDMESLERMAEIFEMNGYRSAKEEYCFRTGDPVYKYFEPTIGNVEPTSKTYGMQCGHISSEKDQEIIDEIENGVPGIVGYILNNKPCFYSSDMSKASAIYYLDHKGMLDRSDTKFYLGSVTDKCIYDHGLYTTQCYMIGKDRKYKSLHMALGKSL